MLKSNPCVTLSYADDRHQSNMDVDYKGLSPKCPVNSTVYANEGFIRQNAESEDS